MSQSAVTVPSLRTFPDNPALAAILATEEQVTEALPAVEGDDGELLYETPNDRAVVDALRDGWQVLLDTAPVPGRDVYLTVLAR